VVSALEAMVKPMPARDQASVLVGLIGRGIQASLSPRMHEAEGRRLGLGYTYKLIDVDLLPPAEAALQGLISAAEAMGFSGLNITHPFKEQVIAHLDRLSPDAAAIGAVNTVVFEGGARVGYNTDCWGFAESFRRYMPMVAKNRVLLLGAGGAGLAVGRALLELGVARILVCDVNAAKAAALVAQLGPDHAELAMDAATALHAVDGLVNATPVGMANYPGSPVPLEALRRDLWVADIIYFPAETALLRAARAMGCITLPGAGMAVFQAVKAFELFSGIAPDAEAMTRHFQATGKVATTD
jgi:shikimate dehydrogenase